MIALFVCAYFLGAIPFGVMVARRHGVDILKAGSGNPGATNVWRAVSPKAGGFVFFLDMMKGCIPAAVGLTVINQQIGFIAGMLAVVGHTLSPFLKFKGGKGIATAFGAGLGSIPLVALSAIAVFFILLALTRYVSLSSIVAVPSAVVFGILYHVDNVITGTLIALAALIVYRHRSNIVRLLNGTESKFQFRKRDSAEPVPANSDDNKDEAAGLAHEPGADRERTLR